MIVIPFTVFVSILATFSPSRSQPRLFDTFLCGAPKREMTFELGSTVPTIKKATMDRGSSYDPVLEEIRLGLDCICSS